MAKGRLLVLVNRHASRAEALIGDALAGLVAGGYDLDVRQPDDLKAQCQLIRRDGPSADGIVIAGGDGTVSGAGAALIAAASPVGILPLGTAKDLALTLGIPATRRPPRGSLPPGGCGRASLAGSTTSIS
jgi:diacylglycerol kinase family enzyme